MERGRMETLPIDPPPYFAGSLLEAARPVWQIKLLASSHPESGPDPHGEEETKARLNLLTQSRHLRTKTTVHQAGPKDRT